MAQFSPLEHSTGQDNGLCDALSWPGSLHRFSTDTQKTVSAAENSFQKQVPLLLPWLWAQRLKVGATILAPSPHCSLTTKQMLKPCMYVHKGKAPRLLAGRVTTITHRIINGVNSDKLISHFIH